MLKNYFKIAWRNLLKDRQFTFLNLVGLSTGLACSLLIYLWIADELKVDKYNEKDKQLYQVMTNVKTDDGIKTGNFTPGLLGESLEKEIPEIQYAVSVMPASWFPHQGVISAGETHIKASGQYVGKDFFNVFTCPYIEGDQNKLAADKFAVAISEDMAKKLFRTTENVVGKRIKWDMDIFGGDFIVTGIFKKNPPNATVQFDLLFNYDLALERRPEWKDWGNSDPHTFVVLNKNAKVDEVNKKIKNFIQTKRATHHNSGNTIFLTKYSDRYLYGKYENGMQAGGRIAYVKLFSIIALVILVIACINFMNLSTAKAARRMKEVGIKKVVGASRRQLIFQYLGESMLMSFLSLALAIIIMAILLPAFNQITGKQLNLEVNGGLVLSVLSITLLTGILSGSYPAFYLSGFNPVAVLKGRLSSSIIELFIRRGLVVFQFCLSAIFMVAVLIVYSQINYIQTKNLGYNRDNVIHFEIPFGPDSVSMAPAISFIHELKNIPGVVNASSYWHTLTGMHGSIGGFQWPGKDNHPDIDFANLEVGYNFLETAGIRIKEGRNFSPDDRAHNEIIFNEAAIKAMGLKDPIGKTVRFWDQKRVIVGIAKDFHFESLYENVKPCFFQEYPAMPNVLVRIKNGTEKETIEKIHKAYSTFGAGLPFDYKFLDEDYQKLYTSEQRISQLSRYFAGLAIIISCLGLFGLAAFTAQKRKKEIGIRKVVGATAQQVVLMLSKDFMKLMVIAICIAFPISWVIMRQWLDGFAYRTDISADTFLLVGTSTVIIAILTISFQAIKAALANPAESLKTE